jgi:hypothetical protein
MESPGVIEYRMIVANAVEGDPVSPDVLRIELGLEPGIGADDWLAESADGLARRVQHATEVTPELRVVPMSDIYDPNVEFKARRIVDTRVFE